MKRLLLSAFAGVALAACERPAAPSASATPIPEPVAKTKTFETRRLGNAIDDYAQSPTAEHAADVKKATADLDGEIAELEARVAKTSGSERDEAALKHKNLTEYRNTQVARFELLRAKGALTASPEKRTDARSAQEKAEEKAKDVGDRVEDGAKRVGDSLEKAGRDLKDAIKDRTR